MGNSDSRCTRTYAYDSDNRLTLVGRGKATLSYDAAGRLGALVANGACTREGRVREMRARKSNIAHENMDVLRAGQHRQLCISEMLRAL